VSPLFELPSIKRADIIVLLSFPPFPARGFLLRLQMTVRGPSFCPITSCLVPALVKCLPDKFLLDSTPIFFPVHSQAPVVQERIPFFLPHCCAPGLSYLHSARTPHVFLRTSPNNKVARFSLTFFVQGFFKSSLFLEPNTQFFQSAIRSEGPFHASPRR